MDAPFFGEWSLKQPLLWHFDAVLGSGCPFHYVEQQAILSVQRARQGFVKARAAQANQIRGLLSAFGIVIPQGIHSVMKQIPEILEDGENDLPGTFRHLIARYRKLFGRVYLERVC